MKNHKRNIFLSHASEDRSIAQRVCEVLESSGMTVRYSGRDIRVGEEWDKWITSEIKRCSAVVVVISEAAQRSKFVQGEVHYAQNAGKKLIPFFIESVDLEGGLFLHLGRLERINAVKGRLDAHLTTLATRLKQSIERGSRIGKKKGSNTTSVHPTSPPAPSIGRDKTPSPGFDNPYEFDVAANKLTFKGRQREIQELVDSVESGTHTAIFGLQRMGKTSLVEEGLRERLRATPELEEKVLLARVNFQEIGDDEVKYRDLMGAILNSTIESVTAEGLASQVKGLRPMIKAVFSPSDYDKGDRSEIFERFARLLQEIAHHSRRRIVLFIDEFSEIRKAIERNNALMRRNPGRNRTILPHDMFLDVPFIHQLGSLLKNSEFKKVCTFIVAIRPFMSEFDEREGLQLLKLLKPVTVYYLDEPAARSLILEPLKDRVQFDDDAVSYLLDISRGHPYLLQFILKMVIDGIRSRGSYRVTRNDIVSIEERMVSEGPAFDPQFAILVSDYSVNEVSDRNEADLGRGALALIAKRGHEQPEGWVTESQVVDELLRNKVPEGKAYSLLSQLSRTKILEEEIRDGKLCFRMYVPLLRKRFVKQNLYLKYFHSR